ncbi:MAG: hypothetical protein IJ460_05860 [Clostridia bacterium]|nr:hypothetical protein [Clostridia bacterium]
MIQNQINNLSGIITLPFFERMCQKISISEVKKTYELFESLYLNGQKQEVFYLLHTLIAFSHIEIPQKYYSIVGNSRMREDFVGEVLTDLEDILCEFE